MKILFNANRFPYPPFRGDKLKIYNLAKQLSKHHELHLLTFLEDRSDLQYLPQLEAVFAKVHLIDLTKTQIYKNAAFAILGSTPLQVAYFQSAAMQAKVDELVATEHFDAVHIQHIRMAQFWRKHTTIPRILDLPDAFSLYWQRRVENSSGLKAQFNNIEYKRLLQYEKVINAFPLSLVCSKEDQQYLQQKQGIANVQLLPNGVDTQLFSNPDINYEHETNILFTGNMDYAPNVDGVCYFAAEIFPIIKQAIPQARFIIAGQRPVEKVLALQNDDIDVTGFIPHLADIYKDAAIVVSPLRFGAGTQNKVLEAMSMAVPVVSMNVGFEGLNISSGEGVFLEPTGEAFAARCIHLMQNKAERQTVGQKGLQIIQARYTWEKIAEQLERYFQEVITKQPS